MRAAVSENPEHGTTSGKNFRAPRQNSTTFNSDNKHAKLDCQDESACLDASHSDEYYRDSGSCCFRKAFQAHRGGIIKPVTTSVQCRLITGRWCPAHFLGNRIHSGIRTVSCQECRRFPSSWSIRFLCRLGLYSLR